MATRIDTSRVQKMLDRAQRQIPFATSQALNDVANKSQKALRMQAQNKLDRPTRFTLKGFMVRKSTKRDLKAYVFIRDEAFKGTPPVKYLAPQVDGGGRNYKRHEKALQRKGILPRGKWSVPGKDARLNRFGNLTAGTYTKILSQLRASPDPMQNRTNKRAQYFVMFRGGTPLGVYQRTGKRTIKSILYFASNTPTYRTRLPFYKIVEGVFNSQFDKLFRKRFRAALRTAR